MHVNEIMTPPLIWLNSIPRKFRVLLKLVLEKQHEPLRGNDRMYMQCRTCFESLPGLGFPKNKHKQSAPNKDSRVCFLGLAIEIQDEHARL